MTPSGPSSNWRALQKSLVHHGHLRKRRKVDGVLSGMASAFPHDTASPPQKRHVSDGPSKHVDLETTEVKNGESVAALRRMVLGKVDYKTSQTAPGKYLALDCEMVGVGIEGSESSLARVSVVNYAGAIILDVFVRQREKVVDYRTQWSGVRSTDLAGSAKPFKEVQETVANLVKDRILVGHAIFNDLKALLLSHPSPQIRDTQSLAYKHRMVKSRRPALRVIVQQELGITIQGGEHSSVTDARATMALFRLYKKQWESGFRPLHTLARSQSSSKADGDPASETRLSPSSTSSLARSRKRKHAVSGDDVDAMPEMSSPSSPARACSPSPSSSLSTTPHASTAPQRRRQKSRSRPPTDLEQQKGISSGITTVTKRAGGKKEVRRKGAQTGDGGEKDSTGGKKTSKSGGKWWKSLGGGKKGNIKP